MSASIRIGILTVSDRASNGEYEDISGQMIVDMLTEYLACPWQPIHTVIPDEYDLIKKTLVDMIDNQKCCLVVTTGGTGPAIRDVTPQATNEICEKMLPGFGELMRSVSCKDTPTAILSTQSAGVRNRALIVNLPGKPQAVEQCFRAVFPAIPDCIDRIEGPSLSCNSDIITVYRH